MAGKQRLVRGDIIFHQVVFGILKALWEALWSIVLMKISRLKSGNRVCLKLARRLSLSGRLMLTRNLERRLQQVSQSDVVPKKWD